MAVCPSQRKNNNKSDNCGGWPLIRVANMRSDVLMDLLARGKDNKMIFKILHICGRDVGLQTS